MSEQLHEHHDILESDEHFESGTLFHLVPGNEGRVLDGRRTPGFIESYDPASAMFVWRITAFEDKGNCWEIPADEISSYQFRKGSSKRSEQEVAEITLRCQQLQQPLIINRTQAAYAHTQSRIEAQEQLAADWLKANSRFFQSSHPLKLDSQVGNEDLYRDLEAYMKDCGVYELEEKTAAQYLLNPYSGEWIKGLKIVMAEMGFIDYRGTIPRTADIFTGIGERSRREAYILARTAFVRSVFKLAGMQEVPLFRGMCSAIDLYETPCTLVSATFSANTAKAFACFDDNSCFRSSYLIKFMYPVDNLFMTFFETKQLNERYKEQEAIIFYRNQLTI